MMTQPVARLLLRAILSRMLRDPDAFNRILGRAVLLQLGRINDEEFRLDLEAFYAQLDVARCAADIDLAAKARILDRPGGYKTDVVSARSDAMRGRPGRFDLWGRRFGLCRRLSIRSDVLILRAGDQIPPHGHSQVVSGFFVLEGEVAVRHYDRVEEFADHVLLRQTVDTQLVPGGYTTNSEYHHNIHWLLGIAPVSYLFRLTVTDVPVRRFGVPGHDHSRAYVDPTVAPDASGLIPAPYLSEADARKVAFTRPAASSP